MIDYLHAACRADVRRATAPGEEGALRRLSFTATNGDDLATMSHQSAIARAGAHPHVFPCTPDARSSGRGRRAMTSCHRGRMDMRIRTDLKESSRRPLGYLDFLGVQRSKARADGLRRVQEENDGAGIRCNAA